VWDQAERRLESQLKQADALDTKAGALVGLHAVAGGLAATLVGRVSGTGRWLAVAAIIGLLASGWFAFRAFQSEAYDRRPAPEELWRFGGWSDDEILYRFLTTRFEALEANRRRLEDKARNVVRSLAGLGVIALVVATASIVALIGDA
jgi:hypothetical protein